MFCNTSPLQYLHQIGQLELLPRLVPRIAVPIAVADELAEGRRLGLDLPVPETLSWVDIHRPREVIYYSSAHAGTAEPSRVSPPKAVVYFS